MVFAGQTRPFRKKLREVVFVHFRLKEEGFGNLAPHSIFWIICIILFQKEKKMIACTIIFFCEWTQKQLID